MRELQKIKVLEKANKFVLEIYQVTKDFPKEELWGITNQIRRASVSIPNNIAKMLNAEMLKC